MNDVGKDVLKSLGYLAVAFGIQLVSSSLIWKVYGDSFVISTDQAVVNAYYEKVTVNNITYSMLLSAIVTIIAFIVIYKLIKKNIWNEFGLNNLNFKHIIIFIIIGIAGWMINSAIVGNLQSGGAVDKVLMGNGIDIGVIGFIIYVMTMGVIVPISEELVFRGAVFNTLRKSVEVKNVIIVQAILFGMIHGNTIQFLYTTFLGFIFGYLTYKCKSLWPAIIVHVTNNLIGIIVTECTNISTGIISFVVGVIALSLTIIFIKKQYKAESIIERV